MNRKLSRMFECIGGSGWWFIILFFLFLVFQECFIDICLSDWIPFLILLLIVCSCDSCDEDYDNYTNNYTCGC